MNRIQMQVLWWVLRIGTPMSLITSLLTFVLQTMRGNSIDALLLTPFILLFVWFTYKVFTLPFPRW